ncbi:MAG: hypothetical protein GY943_38400, partial [Chloroflexi bacterium]|nr:hypothetical protein [Chloroflexota bacterium]
MTDQNPLPNLLKQMHPHFNVDELRQLCFALSIEYEDIPGDTRMAKVQALIAYCLRHNQLPQLEAQLRDLRPKVAWPDLTSLADKITKVQNAIA